MIYVFDTDHLSLRAFQENNHPNTFPSAVGYVVPEGNASSSILSVMRFATQKHILRWNDDLPVVHNAILVTRNRKDFQQVPDLKFEDWSV